MATKTFSVNECLPAIYSGGSGVNAGDAHMPIGEWAAGLTGWNTRALLKAPISFSGMTGINAARLYYYQHTAASWHAKGSGFVTVGTRRKTADWSEASGSGGTGTDEVWGGSSGTLVSAGYVDDGDILGNVNNAAADGTLTYVVITEMVKAWFGGAANYGLMLYATGGASADACELYSRRASGRVPYIWIDYDTNSLPTAPTITAPADGAIIADLTPTLACTHNDPDGDPISYVQWLVLTGGGTPVWDSGTVATSDETPTIAVPAGEVYRGGTFVVRARTHDGTGWGPYSALGRDFKINSLPTATWAAPNDANGKLAHLVYTAGSGWNTPRLYLDWNYADAQSQAQTKYEVEVYADSAGVMGALLYSSGQVSSSASVLTVPLDLVEGNYYWVRVRVFDGLEWSDWTLAGNGAATRCRARWGLGTYRRDLGSVPTAWGEVTVHSTVDASKQAITLEYNSTATAVAATDPWRSALASVTKRQFVHYRAWLFYWGTSPGTSPSLDDISIKTTLGLVQPDLWQPSPLSGVGASIEASAKVFGTQSLRIEGSGGTRRVYELVQIEPDTDYILQGRIMSVGNSGGRVILASPNSTSAAILQTPAASADQSFTTMTSPYWNSGPLTEVYVCAQVTGAVGTAALFDGLKLEQGRVASPWVPGLLGAGAVVDAGGVQVDASAGGVFRLRAADGVTTIDLEKLVRPQRFVALPGLIDAVPAGSTTTVALTTVVTAEITGLPLDVVAVAGYLLASSSPVMTGRAVSLYHGLNTGAVASTLYHQVAGALNAGFFVAATGGTNNRQLMYSISHQGSGQTVTYWIRVTGYWTA